MFSQLTSCEAIALGMCGVAPGCQGGVEASCLPDAPSPGHSAHISGHPSLMLRASRCINAWKAAGKQRGTLPGITRCLDHGSRLLTEVPAEGSRTAAHTPLSSQRKRNGSCMHGGLHMGPTLQCDDGVCGPQPLRAGVPLVSKGMQKIREWPILAYIRM